MRNNSGPRTYPCGTPERTGSEEEHTTFITTFCTLPKARKILGLLYRTFYNNAPGTSLLELYISPSPAPP